MERLTAGVWSRLLAHGLDCLLGLAAWLFCSMWFLIGLWALESSPRDLLDLAVLLFAMLALGMALHIAYHVVLVGGCGQTLGKMALQIRVVSMDGGPLSFGQAVGRYFATFLSALILGIGFVMAGVRSDKRGLHDLLAGTRVEYL